MTAIDDLPPTVLERYDQAIGAEIVVDPNHRTSADFLLAAAMAQAASTRNRAAIALYRLHAKISAADTHDIRAWCVTAMVPMWCRPPHKIRPAAAHEVFEIVLHWYLAGVCPHCHGRRYELLPGSLQAVGAILCKLCGGLGKEPVHHRLPKRYHDPGRWLADELGNMVSLVERDMAARLRG